MDHKSVLIKPPKKPTVWHGVVDIPDLFSVKASVDSTTFKFV